MRTWLTAILLLCGSALAQGEEFRARVVAVIDGDTVLVVLACAGHGCNHGQPLRIRLAEIDAPEKDQPGGAESKASLAGMVRGKQVTVDGHATDKYGRLVAHLTIGGESVNQEQVRRGMAWEYSDHHRDRVYLGLQEEARRARRGLWASPHPVAPWEWRKQHAGAPAPLPQQFKCGRKRYCSQMRSCAEARFYFIGCGVQALDGDGNGVPCEGLCGPAP